MVVKSIVLNKAKQDALDSMESSISHMAVGSDGTTPTESDTALGAETFRETLFSEESSSFIYQAEIFLDSSENNGNTVRETGSFDASSGGTMYTRNLTNDIVKDSSVELFVTLTITFDAQNI